MNIYIEAQNNVSTLYIVSNLVPSEDKVFQMLRVHRLKSL